MKVPWRVLSCAALGWSIAAAQDRPEADSAPDAKPENEESFSLMVKALPPGWTEKTTSASDATRRQLAKILALVKEGETLESADLEFLKRNRDAAVTALRREMKSGWEDAGSAFETLINLGDAKARAQWFAEFKKGDAERREMLLDLLVIDDADEDVLAPRNKEEEDIYRAALKKPHFVLGAALRISDKPGVATLLLDRLSETSGDEQWNLASVIAGCTMTPKDAQRLLAWAQARTTNANAAELSQLQELAAEIVEKGGESVAEAERLFLDLHTRNPKEVFRSQGTARAFCQGATPASRPLLDELLKSSKDPVIRAMAMNAIARQRGPEILKDLEPLVADRDRQLELWEVLSHLAGSGAREQANEFVLRNCPKLGEREIGYVLRYGSPELLNRAQENAAALGPETRFALDWKTKGRTIEAFFQRMKELGLIDRVPSPEEVARAGKIQPTERLESDRAMQLLAMIGAKLEFDSEADVIPAPYDRLLDRIAQFTRGSFAPRALKQSEAKSAADGEEEEPQISVEFVSTGKHFTLKPRPIGDWYDIEAVQAAVNRAIEEAGKEERLLAVETSSQEAIYVFGRPALWQEFAKEFAFPLASGASSAVQQGKKYEKEVIEALKEQGQ